MFINFLILIIGFVFLVKGADVLVEGSSTVARRFGLSTFFIGLTIVAFGTSMPELVISAMASFSGSTGIALGNIIGSNISNTLLILGVCSLITPLLVKHTTISKEIPLSLLAVVAVFALANDAIIDGNGYSLLTRIDGVILILFFAIFLFYTFGISREKEGIIEKAVDDISNSRRDSLWWAALMIVGGLAGLTLGGRWIVSSAMAIASDIGISETLVGLTIIALGTSLPELAASAVAAYKGKADIAVGNIVGSNIFNLLWVLGVSSIISPINHELVMNIDIVFLFSITILLLFLVYLGKKNILARREGAVLLVLYVLYIIYLVIRG